MDAWHFKSRIIILSFDAPRHTIPPHRRLPGRAVSVLDLLTCSDPQLEGTIWNALIDHVRLPLLGFLSSGLQSFMRVLLHAALSRTPAGGSYLDCADGTGELCWP